MFLPIQKIKESLANEFKTITKDNYKGVDLRFSNYADLSSASALSYAKVLGESPVKIAEKISKTIKSEYIDKIDVKTPGFINFYLNKRYFDDYLEFLDNFEKIDLLTGKKIAIEHSSPNLFKPFHIGHLANNSYGEALVKMHELAGASVWRISFPSDFSVGIAKAVWALIKLGFDIDEIDIDKIGEAYSYGYKMYEKDDKAKKEIDEVSKIIYNQDEESLYFKYYLKGKDISIKYFKDITSSLNSHFDLLIFESQAEKVGKKVVMENTPKIFKKVESGGYLFEGSKYGLHDDIFINKFGYGTYLTKDLGLLFLKKEKLSFDKSYTLADIQQKSHFNLVKKAAELVDSSLVENVEYLLHGRLSVDGENISSRKGNVLLAEEFIDKVTQKAKEKLLQNNMTVDIDDTSKKIAISAIKFEILKVSMGKNIDFNTQKALSFIGDSGPYVLYSLVRAKSVLNKAKNLTKNTDYAQFKDIELVLQKSLFVFSEAIDKKDPYIISHYLLELSSVFNRWYTKNKILDNSNAQARKLKITSAFVNVVSKMLYALSIDEVEKM